MARLIDDIRAAGRLVKPWFVSPRRENEWADQAKSAWPLIQDPNLTVIQIDNVADYYYQSDQEYWDLRKDFPNLAPPFSQFWVEHHIPARIQSLEKGVTNVGNMIQHGRLGALVTSLDPALFTPRGGVLPGTRWLVAFDLFLDYGRLAPVQGASGPNGTVFLMLDEHGGVLDTPLMFSLANKSEERIMQCMMVWLHPTYLAISFLHCKNVTTSMESMPAPLAKKFRAKHPGVQPTRYRTLVIEPLKAILRTQGKSGEVGLAKAMHICRGHFRDYRQGPGLFGKYHQLVWTPQTLRGGEKGDAPPPREIKVKL
jgi:hypothetical protein